MFAHEDGTLSPDVVWYYAGLSGAITGTAGREEFHASPTSRATAPNKLFYQAIDADPDSPLTVFGLCLLRGKDIDRDILYFGEAVWMQLLGTYNTDVAKEDAHKEPNYGVIRLPGIARFANVTCPLTERMFNSHLAYRPDEDAQALTSEQAQHAVSKALTSDERTALLDRLRDAHADAGTSCSECPATNTEMWYKHPTVQGEYVCKPCYKYNRREGTFTRKSFVRARRVWF